MPDPAWTAGNLADAVRRAAASGAPALITPGRATVTTVTWGELDAQVDAVAGRLAALDLGDAGAIARRVTAAPRVAIALPNRVEFASAFFGALRAGLVAVPVNPGYTARELRHVLGDSAASAIIATGEVLAALAPVRGELPDLRHTYVVGPAPGSEYPSYATLTAALTAARPGAEPGVPAARAGGEDLAVLLYTSGTAGAPKGAMLSHRALIANHLQVAEVRPPIVGPGDVVLLAVPLFHAFGLNASLGAIAWHGACGVLVDRFDPAWTLELITRLRVSVVPAVPQMFAAWVDQPDLGERMASVRVSVSGAAPLDADVAARYLAATGRPPVQGYGLTETAPVVATALASPVAKMASIGRPIPGVEVKLVGPDGVEITRIHPAGVAVTAVDDFDDDAGGAPGTDPGEIVVRGPNLFGGYWPDGAGGPDELGWWPTGDVAYADADGDLFLVDRIGELILVSGFNVYPTEVEQVLTSHPGVLEAAVVGVADRHTGQAVRAYVVLDSQTRVSVEDLRQHCARNLARFKCPAGIEFVAHLPRSATGKVRKAALVAGPAGGAP